MSTDGIFAIKGLSTFYGQKHILKNVSVMIQEKAVTALMGPSGCGKSTLIRCLNRMNDLVLNFKRQGEILYKGSDIYSNGVDVTDLRREIGMVFQKPNPFPKSIFENIAYG